jgi:hypothetical protein
MRNMLAIARRHFTPREIELLEKPSTSSRTMDLPIRSGIEPTTAVQISARCHRPTW